jgi:hypothetical protein
MHMFGRNSSKRSTNMVAPKSLPACSYRRSEVCVAIVSPNWSIVDHSHREKSEFAGSSGSRNRPL